MSEIRVENIIGETGLDAVNFTKGINVTGVTTATTFSGSGASLTSLPAANLTGTLPAISGANLTGLSSGLSMVDMWHVTQQSTFQSETAAVNWGRSSGTITGSGHIGSAMTNSTQYFTSNGRPFLFFSTIVNYTQRYRSIKT